MTPGDLVRRRKDGLIFARFSALPRIDTAGLPAILSFTHRGFVPDGPWLRLSSGAIMSIIDTRETAAAIVALVVILFAALFFIV
ncbi:hypothetical protein, partial [Klebsiella pneumoniae]|uniref:hypothetical protein n=1 Tax=Klebsiella pneumoniae TaxID=573 RepID=UPI0021578495